MVWDATKPAGTDVVSAGDDIIRELKTDIATALTSTEGAPLSQDAGKFPGASTTTPTYHYRGLKGSTTNRPAAGNYGFYYDTTRNVLQRDNGTSWDDVAAGPGSILFPPTVTAWGATSWTPTGGWTINATYTGIFRRVGDTGEYRVNIALAGSPTGNATTLVINLPASNTIDTTKLPGTTTKQIAINGIGSYWQNSTSNGFPIQCFYKTTTSIELYVGDSSGTYLVSTGLKNSRPVVYAANDAITLFFSVPIVEYA